MQSSKDRPYKFFSKFVSVEFFLKESQAWFLRAMRANQGLPRFSGHLSWQQCSSEGIALPAEPVDWAELSSSGGFLNIVSFLSL